MGMGFRDAAVLPGSYLGLRETHPHPTLPLKGRAFPPITHDRVPMDPILIKRIVEAALLAANQPLTAVQLHALFPLDEPAPEGSIAQALESLQADCAERGEIGRAHV